MDHRQTHTKQTDSQTNKHDNMTKNNAEVTVKMATYILMLNIQTPVTFNIIKDSVYRFGNKE